MSQRDLDLELARKTGESLRTIRRRGFSVLDLSEPDFDPEPNLLPIQVVDWDELDVNRRVA